MAPGVVVHGKYELVEIGGVGGMATVWRATQRGPGRFRRTVAIKHLHPHLAAQAEFREMFFEEARVGAEFHDPNLVRVEDFFEEDGQLFLVMEWVEGIDLATYNRYVVATGQQTRWELITAVGIGLLRGLAAVHEHTSERGESAPVLHRDVSPHNVLVSVKGPARLIDFGLALASDRLTAPTPPGTAKGKLAYLSPEVARGERPTPASDQFAAAAVLWEALAGRKLFDGADEAEVFRKLATADVKPLARYRADLPRRLLKITKRALQADPADRFPSARAMALELGQVLRTAQSHVDLYQLLAGTVVDARNALHMGTRTQAPTVGDTLPEEESLLAIPLPFKAAWRRLRSRLPFFGGEPSPRKRAPHDGEPTPTEQRRERSQGVFRLAPGDEAQSGDLRLRYVAADRNGTATETVAHLDVIHADRTARLTLDVPGQIHHAGYLVTSLYREAGSLSLRADPVCAGRSLMMFPYVPLVVDGLTVVVTGVRGSRVFLSLTCDGRPPEHTIVVASDRMHGVVERRGYRVTVEGLAAPWVTLRVDRTGQLGATGEVQILEEDDLLEVVDSH